MDRSLELADAVLYGLEPASIRRLLEAKANPNIVVPFDDPTFASVPVNDNGQQSAPVGNVPRAEPRQKKFLGTPVTMAVMRNAKETVKVLIDYGANIEARYSFKAGLREVEFAATPVFAAVAKSQLKMLKYLVELNARLDVLAKLAGVENNTLLWSASYHGNVQVVKYLLDKGATRQLEISAINQDDEHLAQTPVHIAARAGRLAVVETLIASKANIKFVNGRGETPLMDAIDHDHIDIVRLLVRHNANLLSEDTMKLLFERKNNMVTITAAAEGLLEACKAGKEAALLSGMGMLDVVRFLSTPGDAAMLIVSIIFRQRTLTYTDGKKRLVYKTAHIHDGNFNAVIGPMKTSNFNVQANRAGPCKPLERKRQEFYDRLVPQKAKDHTPMQVPVDVKQCVVKGIHRNTEVLYSIANATSERIFTEFGCQSIIELGWRDVLPKYFLALAVNTVFALLFIDVASELNGGWGILRDDWRVLRTVLLMGCWLFNIFEEVLQMYGFRKLRKLSSYLADPTNVVDFTRIGMTGITIFTIAIDWKKLEEATEMRLLLAVVVFFRWMKVLYCCRGFILTGPRILCITTGFSDMWSFLGVVLCPLIGFVHSYYAMGMWKDDLIRAFDIVYRLGFIGEHDLAEMENVESDDVRTRYWIWIRVLLVAVTFFLSITMMNIFIGVLGESYTRAYSKRETVFWRNRARIVFDYMARRSALQFLFHCKKTGASSKVKDEDSVQDSSQMDEFVARDDDWDYVWFCQPRDDVKDAVDGNLEDDSDDREFENLQRQLTDVKKDVGNIAERLTGVQNAVEELLRRSQMGGSPSNVPRKMVS